MNRLLLAPLLLLLLISCKKNDPVVYPDGEVRLQRIKDKDGRVSTQFEYAPDGKLVSMKNFLFGRATPDETNYFYDGQGRLERVETSTRGHLSCISCDGPALKFTQTVEYNATGQVGQTLHRQENGTITARWNYEYDGNGRLVRRTSTTSSGSKGNSVVYTYDARSNITQVETSDADGRLTNRERYEYDDRPNPFGRVYLGLQTAFFRSPNNVVRQKYEFFGTAATPATPPGDWGELRYTYDATTGYPIRMEESNGVVSVYEYR